MSPINFRAKNHPQQTAKRGACDATDDRETPPEIFGPLHAQHDFTFDAAASHENHKAVAYCTIQENGLEAPWGRRVWCNPPYSNIGAWVGKAWSEMMQLGGGPDVIVMLLPSNRTEQKWWQQSVEPFRDGNGPGRVRLTVAFLPGRPRFFRPSGKLGGPKGDRPPFGCCVLTWSRSPAVVGRAAHGETT